MKNKKTLIGIILGVLVLIIILLLLKGCSAKKYTVTFDSNGGSTIESVKVKENSTLKGSYMPLREGYTFDGWYYNGKLFDFDEKINKNIKLEARWKKIDKKEISFKKTQVSLKVGEELLLEVVITPSNNDEDLVWKSTNESVITVDKNGKIKALKEGVAIVTVKTNDGSKKASCTVTVVKEEQTTTTTTMNKVTQNNNQTTKKTTTTNRKTTTTTAPTTTTKTTTTTTTTKKAQDSYVITIRKITQAGTGAEMQYEIVGVTKNGSSFTQYSYFSYNGYTYRNVAKTIYADRVGGISAKITLNDGSVVDATVSIQ